MEDYEIIGTYIDDALEYDVSPHKLWRFIVREVDNNSHIEDWSLFDLLDYLEGWDDKHILGMNSKSQMVEVYKNEIGAEYLTLRDIAWDLADVNYTKIFGITVSKAVKTEILRTKLTFYNDKFLKTYRINYNNNETFILNISALDKKKQGAEEFSNADFGLIMGSIKHIGGGFVEHTYITNSTFVEVVKKITTLPTRELDTYLYNKFNGDMVNPNVDF